MKSSRQGASFRPQNEVKLKKKLVPIVISKLQCADGFEQVSSSENGTLELAMFQRTIAGMIPYKFLTSVFFTLLYGVQCTYIAQRMVR